jgi:hypothetical protein
MKLIKYITLIGLLCAGLTSLARADLNFLGTFDSGSAGDQFELATFIAHGGDSDAEVCAKIESLGTTVTDVGTFTITDNGDDTITVDFIFTEVGSEICGFLVKDGQGTIGNYYSVTNGQGAVGSGSFDLVIPGNGSGAFSHLSVFCCPAGVTIPDGGATAALLGLGLAGLGGLRAKFGRN